MNFTREQVRVYTGLAFHYGKLIGYDKDDGRMRSILLEDMATYIRKVEELIPEESRIGLEYIELSKELYNTERQRLTILESSENIR